MNVQNVIYATDTYQEINEFIKNNNIRRIFLVCDNSFQYLKISHYFNKLENQGIQIYYFNDFKPNPLYESVVEGVRLFNSKKYDVIIAAGGGSAMDVAKCIKLYSNMDDTKNYLEQEIIPNDIKLAAIPTTAGTGSEATRYAVIYYNGEKQSITDYSCIPSTVIIDTSVLSTLPLYQKKATMMDALCHAIESYWSVNSNDESKKYSKKAIQLIMENMEDYINNNESSYKNMMEAAYTAGKAINITQTTAGHALCYKLTSLYGIAHGHAAVLCVSQLWPYMYENIDKCIDSRGRDYLIGIFNEIAIAMNCDTVKDSIYKLNAIIKRLELNVPVMKDMSDYNKLVNSVNPVRLKNNPVELNLNDINNIYHKMFEKEENI
ncbi:MAG: phosphonoacetaldehyde reductase [Erysipelotrichaceae bacterium]|nr:phosphonoacetaldehyde reductase [Erysipelotrichaceae bacterium]